MIVSGSTLIAPSDEYGQLTDSGIYGFPRFPGRGMPLDCAFAAERDPGTGLDAEPELARPTSNSVSRPVSTWAWAWTRAGLADFAEPTERSLEGEERYVVQAAILGAGHVRCEDLDDEHLGEELNLGRQQVARVGHS